jgi:hypothetical protein
VTSSASLANQIRRRPFGPKIMLSNTIAVGSEAKSGELQVHELVKFQRWSIAQTCVPVTGGCVLTNMAVAQIPRSFLSSIYFLVFTMADFYCFATVSFSKETRHGTGIRRA